MDTLLQSLPLVHKYDCNGVKSMLDDLDSVHFPNNTFVKKQGIYTSAGTWPVHHGTPIEITPQWLTQVHIDYLVLKQELYGSTAALTTTMKKLLARLLTAKLYSGNLMQDQSMGYGFGDQAITALGTTAEQLRFRCEAFEPAKTNDEAVVVGRENDPKALLLPAWRISSSTYASLLPFLCATPATAK